MRRRRGIALVGVLAFAGLFLTVTLATLGMVDSARARLDSDKQRQQAIVLAISGVDYARASHVPQFRSPEVDGGWFEFTVDRSTIHSVGHFAHAVETVERSLR